jgi:hypothetical protein
VTIASINHLQVDIKEMVSVKAGAGASRRPTTNIGNTCTTAIIKCREAVAWVLVLLQFLLLVGGPLLREISSMQFSNSPSISLRAGTSSRIRITDNNNGNNSNNNSNIQQVWHGGTPEAPCIRGTRWCSAQDDYCMCSPSLAIDVVLISGPDHVWLVKGKDTNQYANMGGFVNVGESAESAVLRERPSMIYKKKT